jgi:hypothetical protein
MKLQLVHKDDMELPILLIDSIEITATGIGVRIGKQTYLIGASYIASLNVIWQTGTIWLGITSLKEAKWLHKELFYMESRQYA